MIVWFQFLFEEAPVTLATCCVVNRNYGIDINVDDCCFFDLLYLLLFEKTHVIPETSHFWLNLGERERGDRGKERRGRRKEKGGKEIGVGPKGPCPPPPENLKERERMKGKGKEERRGKKGKRRERERTKEKKGMGDQLRFPANKVKWGGGGGGGGNWCTNMGGGEYNSNVVYF